MLHWTIQGQHKRFKVWCKFYQLIWIVDPLELQCSIFYWLWNNSVTKEAQCLAKMTMKIWIFFLYMICFTTLFRYFVWLHKADFLSWLLLLRWVTWPMGLLLCIPITWHLYFCTWNHCFVVLNVDCAQHGQSKAKDLLRGRGSAIKLDFAPSLRFLEIYLE